MRTFHVVASFALLRWNLAVGTGFRVLGYRSHALLFGGVVVARPLSARFVGMGVAVNEAIAVKMLQ